MSFKYRLMVLIAMLSASLIFQLHTSAHSSHQQQFEALQSLTDSHSPYLNAQILYQQRQKQGQQDEMDWILNSPALEMLSGQLYSYIATRYGLSPSAPLVKTDKVALANTSTPADNIMINDPQQDFGLRIQNQTMSAATQNNIVVTYNNATPSGTAVSYSFDAGQTWQGSFIRPIPGGQNLGDSTIAVDSRGRFFVASAALKTGNLSTLAVSRSDDGGATWNNATDLLGADARQRTLHDRPWLAVDPRPSQTRTYVSWTKFDDMAQRSTIMFAQSTDSGRTFSKGLEITPDAVSFNVDGSRVVVNAKGEIYLTWVETNSQTIRFAKSTNNGMSFSKPSTVIILDRQATPKLLNGHFLTNSFPSLAVDTSNAAMSGRLYLVYNAQSSVNNADKSDIFLVSSVNGGDSWSTPRKINDDNTFTDQWMPSIAVTTSGNLGIFWYDRRNDTNNNSLVDVYLATSKNGGESFSANVRVSNANWPLIPTPTTLMFGFHGEYNQISTSGERFNLHWGDDRSGKDTDIYFASLPVEAATSEDFVLSGRTIFGEAQANQQVKLLFDSIRVGAFNDHIELTAQTDLPNATITLSDTNILAGNGFQLTIDIPVGSKPGYYTLFVTGQAGELNRTTISRFSVKANRAEIKPISKLAVSPGNSSHPQTVADPQGHFHMVWQDDSDGASQIFYANSLDGKQFSNPINISNSFDPAIVPIITTDLQGHIHIIWLEQQAGGSFMVHTRSDNGGQTFTPKRLVTNAINNAADARMALAADGTINLVWTSRLDSTTSAIMFAQSKDLGESFSTPQVIISAPQTIYKPTITIDPQGTIHLAYGIMLIVKQRFNVPSFNAELFYMRSNDQGSHFTEPVVVLPIGFILADAPILFADGTGHITMIFAAFDNTAVFASREIYYAQSFDKGASFVFSTNPLPGGNGDSTNVVAASSPDGTLNVVWRDTQPANYEIFISRLLPGAFDFTAPVNISGSLGISENPTIAINSQGQMLMAWEEEASGNNEIAFSQLTSEDLPPLSITNFAPAQADIDQVVEVQGIHLKDTVEVKVGKLSAKFSVISDDRLTFIVPRGVSANAISIFSPTGQATSATPLLITGKIGVFPTLLDFGTVGISSTITKSLQLVNTSSSAKVVRGVSFANPGFKVASNQTFPLTIPAQSKQDLAITFAPPSLGLQGSEITLLTDDTGAIPLTIDLIGIANDDQPPQVSEVKPAGGELVKSGDSVMISWAAVDKTALASQDILLSLDGGKTFPIVIASNLIGVRTFLWMVPNMPTTTAQIKIAAIDLSGNQGAATSKNFTIKAPRKTKN